MILTQVREIVTSAIDEPCPPLSVMAFHQGILLPDWVLGRMIDAATRGYITEAGKRMLLIPTKTYDQANKESVERIKAAPRIRKNGKKRSFTMPWPEVQKRDCLALSDYLPEAVPTETRNQCFDPAPHKGFRAAIRNGRGVAKGKPKNDRIRNANCLSCGSPLVHKRCGAKFCDVNCKQKFHRDGRGRDRTISMP